MITRYSNQNQNDWNSFLRESNVDCFLFERNFMEYHVDRFKDHSLFYKIEDKISGLLPAHEKNGALISHGGLTFGSWIFGTEVSLQNQKKAVEELISYSRQNKFASLLLKTIPDYYLKELNQAMPHFLKSLGFGLERAETSFVLDRRDPIVMNSRRKRGVKTAQKENVVVAHSNDLEQFWNKILIPNLLERFQSKPVHTLTEIEGLAHRFPEGIQLLAAFDNQKNMLGGILFFANCNVVHTQYISANEAGKNRGALDLILHDAINAHFANRRYISLGTSNEHEGREINWGLANWKMEFGCKVYSHLNFEIKL